MGNDNRFVQAEELPFRLVEVPVGSAPPPPSPPYIRKSYKENKRHAPPIPPPRVEGYDAPPSLPPPPAVPRRFDLPAIQVPPRSDLPRIQVPPRSDLPQSHPKTVPSKYVSKQKKYYPRKIRQTKMACCVIC